MEEQKKRVEGRPPSPRSVDFWADLGFTLIKEIRCGCGYTNKVESDWHSGLLKVECGGCFEELDLQGILHTPDLTDSLIKMIDGDVETKDFVKEPVPIKHAPRSKTKRENLEKEELTDFINQLPAPVAEEVKQYAEFLKKQDLLDEKIRQKKKEDFDKWRRMNGKE